MLRTTLRSLFARKFRLVLSALAIVLGVGFVAGTFILTDTLNQTFNNLFADIDKNTSVQVRSASNLPNAAADQSTGSSGGSGRPVPASVLDTVRSVPGVGQAVGTVQSFSVLYERAAPTTSGTPVQPRLLSNDNAPPIGVAYNDSTLSPLHLDSGKPPTGPADIVVDRGTFDQKKLRLGQPVSVQTQTGLHDGTIVGTFTFGASNNLAGATLVAYSLPTAQQLLGLPGQFTNITIAAASGVSQEDLQKRIAAKLPPGLEALTGKQIIKENADSLAKGLGGFSTFIRFFGYIALFVGAFIISNTFSMLIGQRVRELALLRAIGASTRQIRRSVIIEALIVGLVGSTLGLAFGFGVAVLLKAVLGAVGIDLPASGVVFTARTAIVSYLIGTLATVVAAYLPARRAAKVPPVAAMRDMELTPSGGLRNRTALGAAFLVPGVVLILLGLNTITGNGALVAVGGGAAAVFIGVATLSPLISRPVLHVVGAPFAALFGTVGNMSRENARRSPRRTSATAAALMIGLALVSAFSVFGTSIKSSIRDLFGESLKADLIVQGSGFNQQPFSPTVAADVRKLPDVAAVSQLRFTSVDIDGKSQNVQAMNPEGLTDVLNLRRQDGRLDLTGNNMLVSSKVLKDSNWKVGQTVTIRWAETGNTSFRIAGTYQQNQLAGSYLLPLSAFDKNVSTKLDSIVLVKATNGSTLPTLRASVTQVLTPYPNLEVRDQKEYVAENAKQINQILGLITALLAFAILIATFGIVNTLLLSVVERTREIGLLRAVGLQRRQTRVMIRLEAIMIAIYGGLLGLVVGSFFGWALVSAFTKNAEFGSFHYPFTTLIVFLLVSALLGVLAAIIPAWRASRTNVLQAIAAT